MGFFCCLIAKKNNNSKTTKPNLSSGNYQPPTGQGDFALEFIVANLINDTFQGSE